MADVGAHSLFLLFICLLLLVVLFFNCWNFVLFIFKFYLNSILSFIIIYQTVSPLSSPPKPSFPSTPSPFAPSFPFIRGQTYNGLAQSMPLQVVTGTSSAPGYSQNLVGEEKGEL